MLVCVGYDREFARAVPIDGPLRQAARDSIVVILSTVLPKTVEDPRPTLRRPGCT